MRRRAPAASRARARAGESGGRRAGGSRLALAGRPKVERMAGKQRKPFSFLISNPNFPKQSQIQNLKWKMAFSKLDPKTKVVQNLIFYNISLGHKFEIPNRF
jgi:hypothetical protein